MIKTRGLNLEKQKYAMIKMMTAMQKSLVIVLVQKIMGWRVVRATLVLILSSRQKGGLVRMTAIILTMIAMEMLMKIRGRLRGAGGRFARLILMMINVRG